MRRAFTKQQLLVDGMSLSAIRWRLETGTWQALMPDLYLEGSEPASPMERALAVVTATSGVASGSLAGRLYGLDSIRLQEPFVTIPRSRRSKTL